MIVVDANILAELTTPRQESESTDLVFSKDPDWVGPSLLLSEIRNTLATRMRHRLLDLDAAIAVMEEAEDLLEEREFPVSSSAVLNLAARSGCTAYDCEYVALAMDLKVPLVTRDKDILAAFPKIAVTPEAFLRR